MPMWYGDLGNSEHKRKVLKRFQKLNGRNMAEMGKMIELTAGNG